ncbi:xanthine dehydrogenase accessory factor [Candidatus Magnetomoraceae bacterium gMMP-15]
MNKLIPIICQKLNKKQSFVMATILSKIGSTPRTPGTKMLIFSDGNTAGTIGGGVVEAKILKTASEIFKTGHPQIYNFDLNTGAETMDMICGGKLEILIELIEGNSNNLQIFQSLFKSLQNSRKCFLVAALDIKSEKEIERCLVLDDDSICGNLSSISSKDNYLFLNSIKKKIYKKKTPLVITSDKQRFLVEPCVVPGTVYLFGAGHVSRHVANLSKLVDFRTVVLDDRSEFANKGRFKDADDIIVLDSFDQAFNDLKIDSNSYIVILSRAHKYDKTILSQALKTKAGYIGMIGSKKKRSVIYKALLNEGITEKDLDMVFSPIGLEIGAETPEEIAVSIISELIKIRKMNEN